MKTLASAGALAGLCLSAPSLGLAQPAPTTLTVGERLTLRSEALGEERAVLVSTPASYGRGEERYPVIYLTDGEGQFLHTVATAAFLARNGRMPEAIVVGITNTDRTRDLTPTRASLTTGDGRRLDFPTAGGADRFLQFVESELVPFVDSRFRTRPFRVFCGHSFGGLFALHAFFSKPDLFGGVVAVSPTLGWDDDLPLRRAEAFFRGRGELPRTLFVTVGNEGPELKKRYERLEALLGGVEAKGFAWGGRQMMDEDHGSLVLTSHYLGLRKVFEDWPLPRDPATGTYAGGLAGVREHYAKVSARLGYAVEPPEATVNNLGYAALQAGRRAEALELFRLNVATYPGSANVYDSLGEGLEVDGQLEAARDQYERAVALGKGDPNAAAFQQHLDAVTARLRPPPRP